MEPISFNQLLEALQERIEQADAYVKKFDFHSFLKLMLFAISKQKDSLRDINADIHNPKSQIPNGTWIRILELFTNFQNASTI